MNDTAALHYDNYMPNLFNLAMDSVYRPELDLSSDSLWQPTFTRVDSLGVLSWMAWHIHETDPKRQMSYITSCLHTNDIGVHRLRVYTQSIFAEPDTADNTARLVYIVEPRDYATEVLNDPWDMTEVPPPANPPAWKTDDITSMTGWNATFTDSISGLFEGTVTNPSAANWMVINAGSVSTEYINTSLYQNISFAGKAEAVLDVSIQWVDEHNQSHDVDLGVDLDTSWTEIGPVNIQNLNPDWDNEKATEFRLHFSHPSLLSPVEVRLGWIMLTE